MSDQDMARVQRDIETMKEAAGLKLPFGWDSVVVSYVMYPVVGTYLMAVLLLSAAPSKWLLSVPVPIMFGVWAYLWYKYRERSGRPSIVRRQHQWDLIEAAVATPILLGYLLWIRKMGYDPVTSASPGVCFVLGVVLTIEGLRRPGRLYYLGASVPLMLLGVSLLLWHDLRTVIFNVALLLWAIGLAGGTIQVYQLKRLQRSTHAD